MGVGAFLLNSLNFASTFSRACAALSSDCLLRLSCVVRSACCCCRSYSLKIHSQSVRSQDCCPVSSSLFNTYYPWFQVKGDSQWVTSCFFHTSGDYWPSGLCLFLVIFLGLTLKAVFNGNRILNQHKVLSTSRLMFKSKTVQDNKHLSSYKSL